MTSTHGNAFESLARLGYGARGLVYCLVGGLALIAAAGSGGQTGGSRSALATLLDQPFGRVILAIVTLGLAGFAVWRIVEGVTDADRRGGSGKALAVRTAHILSGLAYAGLALTAAGMALGRGRGQGDDQAARDWTAWLLDKPFGQWLVGLAGLVIIGTGISFAARAWRGRVTDHMALDENTRRWAVPLGRLGFAARGLIFVLVGLFLVLAAYHGNSSEVKGLGGALQALRSQSYGWVLLGLTAAGLLAFGIFGFVQALYRRIDAPDAKNIPSAVARGANSLKP
ncbi:MAG TPA: DUF1206 domain-containing protein [Beijerinckiaceae bacterium]